MMENYICIVAVRPDNNRPAKSQAFEALGEAQAHQAEYGGIIYDNTTSQVDADDLTIIEGVVSVDPVVPPTPDEIDTANLNGELAVEGSVVRAIAELFFEDRNKMAKAIADATSLASVKAAFPPEYTRAQFIAALKRKMRS